MRTRFRDHSLRGGVDVLIGRFSFNVPVEKRTEIRKLVGIGSRLAHLSFCRVLNFHENVLLLDLVPRSIDLPVLLLFYEPCHGLPDFTGLTTE